MDNLFGEIDCRSKSDDIVMGILRCAMDKAHEKVQSEAGSIEFLHERSKFYELAMILVESGLGIVQEETDIFESNREKVISDLTEMRHWLLGRIKVMEFLINEKDRELIERSENELKLRQVLESREREVIFLRDKLDNQRTMSEGSLDLGLLLKNEAKLEGETSDSKSDSELLNDERCEKIQHNDFYENYHHIPKLKPMIDSLRPEQTKVIQQMSSDIEILKETLDFAFGRKDNGESIPVEKQWSCTIEKDILFVFIRGLIKDIKQRFQDILKETLDVLFGTNVELLILDKQMRCIVEKDSILPILLTDSINNILQRFESLLMNFVGDQITFGFLNDNLAEFIGKITTSSQELQDFSSRYDDENKTDRNKHFLGHLAKIRRTCSEPFSNIDPDDQEVGGINYLAKLIKNPESVTRKHLEDQSYMTKEVLEGENSTLPKKHKELNFLNTMIKDVMIARLDDISSLNVKSISKKYVKCEENFTKESSSNSSIEDKVISSDHCDCEIIKDEVGLLKEEAYNLNLYLSILEEIYLILYEGLFKDQNVACFEPTENTILLLSQFDAEDGISKKFVNDFRDERILPETTGSLLKEKVYTEMFKAWKEERDDFYVEVHIRDDLFKFMMVEVLKDIHINISEYLDPTYKKIEIDGTEGRLIQKLDSMLKCLESEEDLILKASSEIEEYNVCHEQEILKYEGAAEHETIELLLNDDESTFSSLNEKLEITMKQLCTSKTLLFDLEKSLDISPNILSKSSYDCVYRNTSLVVETEKSSQESVAQVDDNEMVLTNQSKILILAQLSDIYQVIQEFEVNVVQNLDMKSSRIKELNYQFHNLIVQPVSLIKKRKLLYKKAFVARCQNLNLAEIEVDLLGDQVEALVHFLENIYKILERNSTILSRHFQVFDILKLIKDELADGVGRASSS